MRPPHSILSLLPALAVLLILSCHPKPSTTTAMSSSDKPGNKVSRISDRNFSEGPSLDHSAHELVAWIESMKNHADGSARRFRLPVCVDRPGPNERRPLRYIAGVQSKLDAQNALELRLDDTGMGIALSDHIRRLCPASPEEVCVISVEGTWGPLLELPGLNDDGRPTIALVHVMAFQGEAAKGNRAFHILAEE